MAKKSKKALELEAENQARKEIIEAIKETERAWKQFFDEAYRVLGRKE